MKPDDFTGLRRIKRLCPEGRHAYRTMVMMCRNTLFMP